MGLLTMPEPWSSRWGRLRWHGAGLSVSQGTRADAAGLSAEGLMHRLIRIGVGYHREGRTLEVHAVAEGGDYDFGGTFRLDWKPAKHFGLTGGYSLLTFKVSHDVASRTLVAKQVLHGPVAGIGLYF